MDSKKNQAQRAKVLALNEHLTPAEIATRIGISRQRVYQILSEEDADYLTLNRKHRLSRRISRNLVKSLSSDIASVDKATRGAIGELIAAADLLALGWKPYVPLFRNHGHDVIALKGDIMITVEVRTARRKEDESIASCKNKAPHPASHFAFVLPDEPVVYQPALPDVEVRGKTHGPPGRRQTYTEEQIREAVALRRAGKSWLSAAKAIGISVTRLQARARQLCQTTN